MASTGGDNAKLSSLFNKKKKGGIKSMNANAIAQKNAAAGAAEATPTAAAAASTGPVIGASSKPKPIASKTQTSAAKGVANSPPQKPQAPIKGVADLTIGEKKDVDEKREFQWAKQPKKYKAGTEEEGVARTWEEQEERSRVARRINLSSERAFPTLGVDAAQAQLSSMKAPQSKAVATKNVWSTLGHGDEDDDE